MKNTILFLLLILGATTTQGQVLVKMSPKVEKPKAEAKTKIIYVDKSAKKTQSTSKNSIEPEMVSIQGASFNMGSNENEDEKPIHRVTVSSFKMAKYEVTVKEFAAFVNATNYQTDAEKLGTSIVFNSKWLKADGVTWRDDEEGRHRLETDWNKPVIHVSWNDATAYCEWLSKKIGKTFRLPTEAEWEFAAGCGAKHYKYSWGSYEPSNSENVANLVDETIHPKYGKWKNERFLGYKDDYFFAAPVGSFQPNELGLYDMTGNVWEWCNDWYEATYYTSSPSMNPKGPPSGSNRLLRGGSWFDAASLCRVAYRNNSDPVDHANYTGFRVVLSQ
jgi:formylglycine-generating enzyme required for sulfatase activity